MNTISDLIREEVRQRYGRIAEGVEVESIQQDCCSTADTLYQQDCCPPADSFYQVDLAGLPKDVTQLSLGCGDPITLAELAPGQVVLDLGSGGGIDCFLAARQVGEAGHVIGVDMTQSMIDKSNANRLKVGLDNVEFRLGEIESLPVESESIDVIISNCVINLSPDKPAVFREAYRVLKLGGRLAVSDMVTQGRFSEQERADMNAWAACITGAEDVASYLAAIREAGFSDISVRDKDAPQVELARSLDLYVGPPRLFSARVTAVKPG
jgi:SAM-dependent methyltransferase